MLIGQLCIRVFKHRTEQGRIYILPDREPPNDMKRAYSCRLDRKEPRIANIPAPNRKRPRPSGPSRPLVIFHVSCKNETFSG